MKVFVALLFAFLCSIAHCGLTNEQLLRTVKSSKRKILPLNDENFENILNGKRDYHIIAFFTSEAPQINCVLCKDIAPEYELVAQSWFQDHPNGIIEAEEEENQNDEEGLVKAPLKNVYFFKSEFVESRKLFSLFQLNNIPKIFYFKPTEALGPNNFLKERQEYQFFQGDQKSLMMSWLQELTGHKFNVYIPINRTKLFLNIFVGFTGTLLAKRFRKQIGNVLLSKIAWVVFSLVAVLLFTTGFMFNKIRLTPYVIEHPDGRTEYFMPGQQTQLGVETQIMSFVYGLLSILVIVLIKRAPEIKTPSVNLVLVVIVSALIFALFSFLLSIFGLKAGGFPYRFIKFF